MKRLVVHCSDTTAASGGGAARIDAMHKVRGFARSSSRKGLRHIGYHFVILRDGRVEKGRDEDETGAHAAGFNTGSLGICLMGGGLPPGSKVRDGFTPAQYGALRNLLEGLKRKYPAAVILGHRDLSPDKDGDGQVEPHEWLKLCPTFDVRTWWAKGRL